MDDDAAWEAHRPEIERLYLKGNITLEELVRIMRVEYNFRKTANQYQSQFRKWNVRKRHGRNVWIYIDHQSKKRKGRETDVFIDGELQDPCKVQREIRRQVYQSTMDRFRQATSPEAPPGVVVCSPQPKMEPVQWTANLPWREFSRNYAFQQYLSSEGHSGTRTVTASLAHTIGHMFPHIHQELMHALNSDLLNFIGLKKTNEDRTSSRACEGVTDYDLDQILRFTMFLLSNKLSIHTQNESPDRQQCLSEEDHRVLKFVEFSGLSSANSFERLLSTAQPSAHAISERIFQSAIRLHELRVVEMMLRAGVSPDLPITSYQSGKELLVSPLEFAADVKIRKVSIELTRLLLSFHANINDFKWKPALQIAIEAMGDHSDSSGQIPREHSGEDELLRVLLKSRPHLETRVRRFRANGPTFTALGLAVSLGKLGAAKLLIDHGANIYAAQRTYLDSDCPDFETDLLGLASKRGDIAMMQILLDASMNARGQSTLSYNLIGSLILAVTFSQEEATKFLLKTGVAVQAADSFLMARDADQRTLVERALAQQNLELHLALVSAGAVVGWPAVRDCYSFKLFRSIKQNDLSAAIDLLSLEAPPDDVYDDFPDSALGAAIAQGNCKLIKLLKIAGVTPKDLRIPHIPDMETARCLEAIKFLPTILSNNGQIILTCAILKGQEDGLVEYLLSRGVDQHEMRLGFLERFDYWLDNLGLPECQTPLEAALTRRNLNLAQTLIHRGAKAGENELNAIVWQAVLTDDDSVVWQFLKMLSTPFQAPTAVGMAVLWGRTDLVRVLLKFGIDPKGRVYMTDPPDEGEEVTNQNSGWWHLEAEEVAPSVLHVAASKGDRSTLQLLLELGIWSEEDKSRALTASIFWKNYHLVSDLLEAGASVNQGVLETSALSDKVNTEMLPLQLAVNAGNMDMVKLLLRRGAKINQIETGVGGKTALQIAAKNGNVELLMLLLEKGAEVNQPAATSMGATALQFAAIEGHIEVVCRLLHHGADVNAPSSHTFGRTAMEGAAERGHLDTLQLLLNHGAQVDGPGRVQFVRSVKLAESNGHFATAKLLKSTCGWTEADRARYDWQRLDEEEHLGP